MKEIKINNKVYQFTDKQYWVFEIDENKELKHLESAGGGDGDEYFYNFHPLLSFAWEKQQEEKKKQ